MLPYYTAFYKRLVLKGEEELLLLGFSSVNHTYSSNR